MSLAQHLTVSLSTLKTLQTKLHNDTEELDKERKRKVDDDKTNGV
jgi:hypothetical protein